MCSVNGCHEDARAKGLCSKHYQLFRKHGRIERRYLEQRGKICLREGCDRPSRSRGFCKGCYKTALNRGEIVAFDRRGKVNVKRQHPLYTIWFERKTGDQLCDEWLDFWTFAKHVGEKPGKLFTLVKAREGKYGPDNFRWRPHLKREAGETKKAWYARKWQARKEANPGWDSSRTMLKKYGITQDDFKRMSLEQNGVCATCYQPETAIDAKTGNRKNLSVDHCHKTGRVRGLLCWRCNTMLGRAEDSIELLGQMQAYLRRHLACEAA